MLDALDEHMPSAIKWTRPKGGFYIWVTLPENIDASAIFTKSIKNGAAFVIGNAFDPDGIRNNCFRLAFSHTPENKIAEGIHIIASATKSELANI
jgi:2-aminoadipate transaminase